MCWPRSSKREQYFSPVVFRISTGPAAPIAVSRFAFALWIFVCVAQLPTPMKHNLLSIINSFIINNKSFVAQQIVVILMITVTGIIIAIGEKLCFVNENFCVILYLFYNIYYFLSFTDTVLYFCAIVYNTGSLLWHCV